jgi:hypothetical protein
MCTHHHALPRSHSHHCRSLHALPRHLALTPSWLVSFFFETAHPEPWPLGPGLEVVETLSHEYMYTYTPITPNTRTVMRVHTQRTHTHIYTDLSFCHSLSLSLSLSLSVPLFVSPLVDLKSRQQSRSPAVSSHSSLLYARSLCLSLSLSLTLSVCLSLSLP